MSQDNCKHCVVRGDIKQCRETDCSTHESWYAKNQQGEIEMLRSALNTRTSGWQPIETIPENQFIDVWVKIGDRGRRMTNVCKTDLHSTGWVGLESHYITDEIYPTHWQPLPETPNEQN